MNIFSKLKNDVCSAGRSMIEMLGVLAIVGVLSVGGIAGYSKAMTKFKVNKLIEEYNMLITGLIEYKSSFPTQNDKGEDFDLAETVIALNLVPETWKVFNEAYLTDSQGNLVNARSFQAEKYGGVVIDFNLGGLTSDENGNLMSSSFLNDLCFEMFNTLIYPLRNWLIMGRVFKSGSSDNIRYYNTSYCGENSGNDIKCLNDLKLSDIKRECDACDGKRRCNVTIVF